MSTSNKQAGKAAHTKEFDELENAVEELMNLRFDCVGRPVVNHEAAEEASALRAKMAHLAGMYKLSGERRACAVFDTFALLGLDCVKNVIGSEIERIAKEFCLGRGFVDRAVFHASGKLSLVEIKSNVSPRDIVGGIGQALMYAGLAEKVTDCSPIMPVLAVLGDHDDDIARACELGGVGYIPLGDVRWLKKLSELTEILAG